MKIEPTYVTFEQAKLLKEKGFNEYTSIGYSTSGEKYFHQGGQEPVKNNQKYYEGRSYEGAPFLCSAPEQYLIVEWLRLVKGIHVLLDHIYYDGFHYGCKIVESNGNVSEIWREGIDTDIDGCDTPQEAYSAALDYILKELI